MADLVPTPPSQDFARVFGDALKEFLDRRGIGQREAARKLGVEISKKGKLSGGSRINSYFRDNKKGKRPKPNAEILWLACTKLHGFSFVYNGYRISAETLNGKGSKPSPPIEQTSFDFEHQFDLTGKQGTIEVTVKRPQGRIEVSLSLDARVPGAQ
jgi:transcriptional regulator with XRE-family HTH domain